MADDETPKAFDAYTERTAKSGRFRGQGSREIRFLNYNGVVFDMAYTDPQAPDGHQPDCRTGLPCLASRQITNDDLRLVKIT